MAAERARHVDAAGCRGLERRHERRPQFGVEGHGPHAAAFDALGLRRTHHEPPGVPLHVPPTERGNLARAAQAAEAREGDNRPPLGIRARIEHFERILDGDKVHPRGIGLSARTHFGEGVFAAEHPPASGLAEYLPRGLHTLGDGGGGEAGIDHRGAPPLALLLGDFAYGLGGAEVVFEALARLEQCSHRAGLHIQRLDERIEQAAQRGIGDAARGNEARSCEAGVQAVIDGAEPLRGLFVESAGVLARE
ncbi:MAG: hypothetical protein ACKVS8_10740 [Phycisphaerales bacterium]